MPQDFSQTQIIVGLCGAGIIFVFISSILYDIVVKLVKKYKDPTHEGDQTSLDIKVLIYTNIFLILCHMFIVLDAFMFSSEDHHCVILGSIGVVLLHTSRFLTYLIGIRRIQVIYNNTAFQLNTKPIKVIYIILFIYYVPYVLYFDWSAVNGTYSLEYGCIGHIESSIYALIFAIIVFLLDVTISAYGVYLFIYPLHKVILLQDDKEVNDKLFNVMTKYLILGAFAITSSFIFFGMMYFLNYGYYYALIDNLINGCILILLHPIHNKHYKRLCCIAHKCCVFRYRYRQININKQSTFTSVHYSNSKVTAGRRRPANTSHESSPQKSTSNSHPSLVNSSKSVSIESPIPTLFKYPNPEIIPLDIHVIKRTPSVNTLVAARAIKSILNDNQQSVHHQHDKKAVAVHASDNISAEPVDTFNSKENTDNDPSKCISDNDDNDDNQLTGDILNDNIKAKSTSKIELNLGAVSDIIMEDEEFSEIKLTKAKSTSLELEFSELMFETCSVAAPNRRSSLTLNDKKSLRFINYESSHL